MPTIRDTARKRLATLRSGDPAIVGASAASRIAVANTPRSREDISTADLKQIKNRQEAESLPEGEIRRKRKSTSSY